MIGTAHFPVQGDFQRLRSLTPDELAIVETIIARIDAGRRSYGPWRVSDGRNNPGEALAEVMDALTYVAAELVRQSQIAGRPRAFGRRIYVCHPFRDDPKRNIAWVRTIAKVMVSEGNTPVAPHLYLPAFVDEPTQRRLALDLGLSLLEACDEVQVFGPHITEGMEREIEYARQLGIPVIFNADELGVTTSD